jgi:hypothetical protein
MTGGLDQTGLVLLAFSLSGPVFGAVFAGAAAAHLATALPGPRALLAMTAALITGVAAGAAGYAGFAADADAAFVLGLVLLVSALVGGLVGVPKRRFVPAGLAATVALVAYFLVQGAARERSMSLFADPLRGYGLWATLGPLIAGMACGFTAFMLLRRRGARLYGYLFAGAVPGLLWLLGTVLGQIGGELLLAQGEELSPLELASWTVNTQSQYNGAMTVLFAGATTAVLAYGLLLPKDQRARR